MTDSSIEKYAFTDQVGKFDLQLWTVFVVKKRA